MEKERKFEALLLLAVIIVGLAIGALLMFEKQQPGYSANPLKSALQQVDKFTIAFTTIIALIIFAISAGAYARIKSTKFALIMAAFGLFALKYVLKEVERYFVPGDIVIPSVEILFDLATIVLLFFALLRK